MCSRPLRSGSHRSYIAYQLVDSARSRAARPGTARPDRQRGARVPHDHLDEERPMTDPICPPGTPFAAAVEAVRRGEGDVDQAVSGLLAELTDPELLWLLDGDVPTGKGLWTFAAKGYNRTPMFAGQIERVGIPGIRFSDGPRGVVMGNSTAFPVAIAR